MTVPLRSTGFLLLLALIVPAGSVAQPQPAKTITIRMIDSKTLKLLKTTDFLIQLNHQPDAHANWVELNDDGSGRMTVPDGAKLIFIQGKYDNSMSLYVNCDTEIKGKIPTLGTVGEDHWYQVADILNSGVVTHNGCGKGIDDPSFVPKPGEYTFFVRKQNWHEDQ
jgi:hypothetical protein